MITKQLKDVNEGDLQRLIAIARPEDRNIEYKERVPSAQDSEKVPWLLKPVCSLANSDGGDLILGMAAEGGLPKSIKGDLHPTEDEVKLRLLGMIETGIEPKVRGVDVAPIGLSSGGFAYVVRVQKSWSAPHRVRGNRTFFLRTSAGAQEMDIPQIRQAFLLADSVEQRMRDFRASRLSLIAANDATVVLSDGMKAVFHVCPLSAFLTSELLDSEATHKACFDHLSTRPGSIQDLLNLEGAAIYYPSAGGRAPAAYTQFFRSGAIETVTSYQDPGPGAQRDFEKACVNTLNGAIKAYRQLSIDAPLFVSASLLNARGCQLGIPDALRPAKPFRRDWVIAPAVRLDELPAEPRKVVKPVFDPIWHEADAPGTPYCNDEGEWTGT